MLKGLGEVSGRSQVRPEGSNPGLRACNGVASIAGLPFTHLGARNAINQTQ